MHLFPNCWQLKHADPPLPHRLSKTPTWHAPDESQHPLQFHGPQPGGGGGEHFCPMHVPPNCVQSVQDAPPMPQAVDDPLVWQVPLWSQQPFGHVSALHDGPLHTPPDDAPPEVHLPPCAAQFAHWLPAWPHAV
jgi:hypothetical protein